MSRFSRSATRQAKWAGMLARRSLSAAARGLLVVKDGHIHLERYARDLTPAGRWQSSSMVKSLGTMLIGAAIQDGFNASVNDRVTNYVPELAGTAYEGVTIRHLLHMASGVTWTENTTDTTTDVHEHYSADRRTGA